MSALDVRSLQVKQGERQVLDDVSFRVDHGELLGLIGPNGAGKSTALRAAAQLQAHRGDVRVGEQTLADLSPDARARQLAYLAQDGQLAWPLSVRDFVALGRLPHRRLRTAAEDARAVDQALEAMALDTLATRPVPHLSGGEKARARLARALAVEAPVLLADEPVASLDPFHQLRVMELLRQRCDAGHAIVLVLHDLTLASRFCDRILLLHHGKTVACGSAREVLTPAKLQAVYGVQVIRGEHHSQPFIVPWRCQQAAAESTLTPSTHT